MHLAAAFDHQETYLKGVFSFLGGTDVQLVRAEGLAMGNDNRAKALVSANGEVNAAFA